MKIVDVKTFLVGSVRPNWLFVKVITDEGIHGWGEASVEGQEKAVEQSIHILAQRSLIGEDPRNIEKLWQKMYHHGFWKGGFIYNSAIAGLDQALWDINGKIYNVPVYMLLGGAVRDKIRTYSHAGPDRAAEIIKLGFAGVKCSGGTGRIDNPDINEAVFEDRLVKMREAIGPDKLILVDNHGYSTAYMAAKLLKIAAKYNVYFFEEAVPPDNPMMFKHVRENAYGVAIASGERLYSRYDYREAVENQLFDIIQPDICHCGGITEIRKIAAMAEVYNIKLAPHNPNGPVATAASLHAAASIQSFDILEFSEANLAHPTVTNMEFKPVDGYFPLPKGPGLGIEINEEAIKELPYINYQYPPRYTADGTVIGI